MTEGSPNRALPVAEADRVDALDALRGFALLGIFISHVPDFSGYSFMTSADRAGLDAFGVDTLLAGGQDFLIRGKFYSLFSLLFGMGFAIQLDSAGRRGTDFSAHFARRLGALFLIGLAHACLWYGDILKDYALIGFALIAVRGFSAARLAIAAGLVLLLRMLWPLAAFAAVSALGPAVASSGPDGDFIERTHAFAGTDPAAVFAANLELLRLKALQMIYDGRAISVLSMFLVGALIGRVGLYRDLPRHRALFRRVLLICGPVGVLGNAVLMPLHAATPDFPPTMQWVGEQVLYAAAVPALALAYASGFALLWLDARRLVAWFASAGRMALTTYVSQTLIGVALFYGVGLGMGGHVGLAVGAVLAIAIFAAQCLASSLWLRAFLYGPLEWLWRCATYKAHVRLLRSRATARAQPSTTHPG